MFRDLVNSFVDSDLDPVGSETFSGNRIWKKNIPEPSSPRMRNEFKVKLLRKTGKLDNFPTKMLN
jgi:hypothetical protein